MVTQRARMVHSGKKVAIFSKKYNRGNKVDNCDIVGQNRATQNLIITSF